ncbi:MAG: AcrR family transcriptional regulator [Candidatus Azotimanducaceae bacterium]|jgi:AcrR family transcriptional regulator
MGRPKIDGSRREEILVAFERCVIREGIANTSLQKVAAEAELPRSLVRYFVGNREDMVTLLIKRIVDRANQTLAKISTKGEEPTLQELLDFLFTGAFLGNTTNSVVDQLWELAASDDSVREELKNMYKKLRTMIANQMKSEEFGESSLDRKTTAHLLLSLAYGEASFDYLGLKSGKKGSARMLAESIVSQLKTE